MIKLWGVQIFQILRMEIRKTFLARRGLWVYLLALAPVVLFAAHSVVAPRREARLGAIYARHPINKFALLMLRIGMTRQEVERRLGQPYGHRTTIHRIGRDQSIRYDTYQYTDGEVEQTVVFIDDKITPSIAAIRATWRMTAPSSRRSSSSTTCAWQSSFGCVGIASPTCFAARWSIRACTFIS